MKPNLKLTPSVCVSLSLGVWKLHLTEVITKDAQRLREVQCSARTSEDAAGGASLHSPATIGLTPSSRLFLKPSIHHGAAGHAHFLPPTLPMEPFPLPSSSEAHDPR